MKIKYLFKHHETILEIFLITQINENWTLDGIHIGPLPELEQWRWRLRLKIWLLSKCGRFHTFVNFKNFTVILRVAYFTFTIFVVGFFWFYIQFFLATLRQGLQGSNDR